MFQSLESFLFSKTQRIETSKQKYETELMQRVCSPVIAYASQAWSANKGEMRDIEKIQKQATSWILGIWESYNYRLKQLELHDALLLLSIMQENYNIRKPESIKNNPGNDINTK